MRETKEFDATPSLIGARNEREIIKRKRIGERIESEERKDTSPLPIVAKLKVFRERGIDCRKREC
jgi:hypothetical protein